MLRLNKDTLPTKLNIETGRGCPYNCTFCSTKTFWNRKVRLKSIDRLINEIKYYDNNYSINNFGFIHDLFTARKQHIMEFCKKLVDLRLNINWTCDTRADTLDEEIVKLMAKAGCNRITLGVETGSDRMQQIINKNLTISKIKETIKLLDKYNIKMKICVMYGFPEEEERDLLLLPLLFPGCA